MTGTRFPRQARLLNGTQFRRVFEQAERSADRFFTVLGRPNGEEGARLGLAISKKVDKRAVGRNRIKRLVRESFRQHREQLQAVDLVVMARPAATRADNETLLKALERHWRTFGA